MNLRDSEGKTTHFSSVRSIRGLTDGPGFPTPVLVSLGNYFKGMSLQGFNHCLDIAITCKINCDVLGSHFDLVYF